MFRTVTVIIGNSDDKLTQLEWCSFVNHVGGEINMHAEGIHFHGSSPATAAWQNAAWCFDVSGQRIDRLRDGLAKARERFRQDSIAWLCCEPRFVEGP